MVASPNDTVLTGIGASVTDASGNVWTALVDANGNVWSLAETNSAKGYQVAVDGAVDRTTAGVI